MSEDARVVPNPFAPAARPASGSSRLPAMLATLLALAASGSLGWWIASTERGGELRTASQPPAQVAAPAASAEPMQYAPADPDPTQVRNAYQQAQNIYADGGPEALIGASMSCAKAVKVEPKILDYCLAFDVYAGQILSPGSPDQAQADWFRDSPARDLALARAALPAHLSADVRLQQVAALTLAALPEAAPEPEAARVERRGASKSVASHIGRAASPPKAVGAVSPKAKAKLLKARFHTSAKSRRRADACRGEPTAADRLVCSHRDLAAADHRMRSAYDRAVASGVDPDVLAEQQADWRAWRDSVDGHRRLSELYRDRIRDLESQAPPH